MKLCLIVDQGDCFGLDDCFLSLEGKVFVVPIVVDIVDFLLYGEPYGVRMDVFSNLSPYVREVSVVW